MVTASPRCTSRSCPARLRGKKPGRWDRLRVQHGDVHITTWECLKQAVSGFHRSGHGHKKGPAGGGAPKTKHRFYNLIKCEFGERESEPEGADGCGG